jgi:glycosyltransferase involved in cell wall biosynthesis
MRGIIDALLELGCHVVVLPDDRARLSPYTEELQKLGAEVLYEIDLSEALRRIGPSLSLAILSRPNVAGAWLNAVRDLAVDAFVAYDSVDLHWLREARRYALEGDSDIDPAELPEDIEAQRELELTLIKAADATVVVSDEEQAQVLTDVPDAVIHVLPTVNPVRAPVPGFGHRDGVVFIASFLHAPNVDGALMLVKEVMPIVWERHGDVRVTIVGEEPPPEVQALAGPLVELTGWVPDIDRYIDNARALLAPLRYGAGIKGKVTQALAAGLPVVTTPIGAEGLPARDGEHLLIGSDAPELAERTIRVLTDAQLWQSLSVRGQQLAAEACSPAVMTERVRKLLEIATAPAQVRAGLVARA